MSHLSCLKQALPVQNSIRGTSCFLTEIKLAGYGSMAVDGISKCVISHSCRTKSRLMEPDTFAVDKCFHFYPPLFIPQYSSELSWPVCGFLHM